MSRGSLLARLKRNWPAWELPADTFDQWLDDLAGVPLPLLEQAVTALILTSEWPPRGVATILNICAELSLGLPSESEALAQVAARAEWAASGDRSRPAPAVADEVRRAVENIGGWRALALSENPIRARADLAAVYRRIRADTLRAVVLGPALPAASERGLTS